MKPKSMMTFWSTVEKTTVAPLGNFLDKIRLLFISTSGHTVTTTYLFLVLALNGENVVHGGHLQLLRSVLGHV